MTYKEDFSLSAVQWWIHAVPRWTAVKRCLEHSPLGERLLDEVRFSLPSPETFWCMTQQNTTYLQHFNDSSCKTSPYVFFFLFVFFVLCFFLNWSRITWCAPCCEIFLIFSEFSTGGISQIQLEYEWCLWTKFATQWFSLLTPAHDKVD